MTCRTGKTRLKASHPWGPFITVTVIIISLWSCLIARTGSQQRARTPQESVYGFVSDIRTKRCFSLFIFFVRVEMFHQNLELCEEEETNKQ